MKPLEHFLIQFRIRHFDKGSNELFVEDNKFFLISRNIADVIRKTKKPFYVGLYIGKARGKSFFPSINLLNMSVKRTQNKIWIDEKTEWLFICGRDIFSSGIKEIGKGVQKGSIVFVLNKKNEVLGFGKVRNELDAKGVVVENILDIGDFLRRERKR